MELKFENRYFATDKMLSEYVHKVLCKRLKLWGLILAIGASIMLFVTLSNSDYTSSAVLGVCLFMAVFVAIGTPLLTLKQLKQNNKVIHNGKKFETIVQFGDKINLSEGAFSLTVEYEQILKTHSLRHSYVLMFGKNNAIMLSPNDFTIGSFEEFVPFLASMCRFAN